MLVPFGDSPALAREICDLLRDETRRHAMRKKAYLLGREMIWSHVAHDYMDSFQKSRRSRLDVPIKLQAGADAGRGAHGPARLEARPPDPDDGFGGNSPARPLHDSQPRGGVLHRRQCPGAAADALARATGRQLRCRSTRLSASYAAFLNYAFDRNRCQFRNFMSYRRSWLESAGSEDCKGRALLALGACVHRSKRRDLQFWASELFDLALPALLARTSPRAWAFGLSASAIISSGSAVRGGQPDPRHVNRSADRVVRANRDR